MGNTGSGEGLSLHILQGATTVFVWCCYSVHLLNSLSFYVCFHLHQLSKCSTLETRWAHGVENTAAAVRVTPTVKCVGFQSIMSMKPSTESSGESLFTHQYNQLGITQWDDCWKIYIRTAFIPPVKVLPCLWHQFSCGKQRKVSVTEHFLVFVSNVTS